MTSGKIRRVLHLAGENPRSLKYLALQTAWSIAPAPPRPLTLSWSLPPDVLSETFIRWPAPVPPTDARWWEDKFRVAFAAHVPIQRTAIPQPFWSILIFDVLVSGREYRVAIDYRDDSEISTECADVVSIYFKLQFSSEGYPFDHVLPGGYVVKQQKFYRYLPHIRALKEKRSLFDVYGRFSPRSELRNKIVSRLKSQNLFKFEGGLEMAVYAQSLWEEARARITLDLPGYGSFCYRLPEYLAIGSCVIALPHQNRLPIPLVDREHIAFTKPDGDDLLDLCEYYLEHHTERENLMKNSRDYFDRYLDYRQLGAYYLSTLIERLAR
jgi:hypothetical protein